MSRKHPFVSAAQARQVPYPYVYVRNDGTARELTADERAYLEEEFHPFDGARPYVKARYETRTPDGHLRGFCYREMLPKDLTVLPSDSPDGV